MVATLLAGGSAANWDCYVVATVALFHFDRLFPPRHGSAKFTRRLAEALATQGNRCVVVMLAGADGAHGYRQNVEELPVAVTAMTRTPRGDLSFACRGVEYRATLRDADALKPFLWRVLRESAFDLALVGDEHPTLPALALEALREFRFCRVVYCAHTVHNLPFGPHVVSVRPRLEDALAGIDAYLTTSAFGVRALRALTGRPVRLLYPDPPQPAPAGPSPAAITRPAAIVNPCVWKGIDLFLSIAERLPHRRFLAVPGWGTTPRDLARLQAPANVSITPWQENVNELLARASLLLVPSVWEETYGMIAVEAAAAGLPVIGSDRGGLPEALLGASQPIPLEPLSFDRIRGDVVVPHHDAGPWIDAIEGLLGDPGRYAARSAATHDAARALWQENRWDRIDVLARLSGADG
jgi:glycosyltransferase involved in cell wall biosynthesis